MSVIYGKGIYTMGEPAPTFAPGNTWYKGTKAKNTIKKITLMDKYVPTGSETESWNCDVDNKGKIKCYITGTELIIAGNGKGKLKANEDSSYMFSGGTFPDVFSSCTTVANLRLLDTSNTVNMRNMFGGGSTTGSVNDKMSWESLDVSNFNTRNVTNMSYMFQLCQKLKIIDVSNFNMAKCKNVASMFILCKELASINVNWPNFKPTNISAAFAACTKLQSISGMNTWNTSECTNMAGLFGQDAALSDFNISNFNTSKVTLMNQMFQQVNVESLDLSHFDTRNVTNMDYMFTNSNLQSINVTGWNVENVESMKSIFNQCKNLSTINGLRSWKTPKLTNMSYMFNHCENLTSIDLTNFDTTNVTSSTNMTYPFSYDYRLKEVTLGTKFKFVGTKSYLPTPSSSYITGATGGWYNAGTTSPKYTPAKIAGLTRTTAVKYVAVPGAV